MMTRLLILIVILPLINACTSVANINVKDNVTFNNIETSFQLSENSNKRIRLRASSVSGKYKQSLKQEHILINGTSIWSPTSFSGNTDIDYISIAYGSDKLTSGIFSESAPGFIYAGLQQTNFDLSLNHLGTSYKITDKISELFFEVGVRFKLSTTTSAEISDAITLSHNGSTMDQIDLKIVYPFTHNLLLTGGYRFYSYTYIEQLNTSDIVVEFNGPFVGLDLRF